MSETGNYQLLIDFDNDGLDSGDTITDWMSATIVRGFNNTLARIPSVGRATFVLDNQDKTYSPLNNANVRPRREVEFDMAYTHPVNGYSIEKLFRGFIESIRPTFNERGDRRCVIECVDAMALLDLHEGPVALQTDVRADDVINAAVNAVYTPPATAYDEGINLYVTSGDRWAGQPTLGGLTEEVKASNKIQDAATGDWGHFFISAYGEPTFYNRHTIRLDDTTELTLTNTMVELGYTMAVSSVYNRVEVTCHPRSISTENEVLGRISQQDAPHIDAGDTETFMIRFRDPANTAHRMGGLNCITPVSGTDFDVTDDPGGEGSSLNGDITPTLTAYGDHAEVQLANGGANRCYVQKLQVRGQAVRAREPVTVIAEDDTSQGTYQKRKLSLDAVLLSDEWRAQMLADWLLDYYKDPQDDVRGVTFVANRNETLMVAAQTLDLLDRVVITEAQTALSSHDGYIYSIRHDIPNKHNHRVTISIMERKPLGLGEGINPFTIGVSQLGDPSTDVLIY